MPGEFLDPVGSIKVFEQVLARVQRLPELDPKAAFRSATPGVIGLLTEQMGPWRGREELRFEIPGVTQGAKAVGPEERMKVGTDDMGHIVALPGFELAGHTQRVTPEMFGYGGMDARRARDLAAKPVLDYNETVSKILFDVITSGDFSGSITDDFAWSANDKAGNSQSQDLITDDADEVANVYMNSNQTFTFWPLRDGSQASAGHDHLEDTGTAWTAAAGQTQANLVLEHPGNGRIVAYVGSTIADAVIADIKSEYGAIDARRALVDEGRTLKGDDFAFASPIGVRGGIEYWHMVDMPTSGMLTVAANQRPFHANIGMVGTDGASVGTGSWTEQGNPETRGTAYGYRQYLAAGVKNPTACAYKEHAA